MAVTYKNLIFPQEVGGPGPYDTVELTVSASGAPTTTPIKAFANLEAYYDSTVADDKTRHERFSDICKYFQQYGEPISIASDGDNVITLKFERGGMFEDSALGKPGYFYSSGNRPNAYDLATSYVADNDTGVNGITVKVNGTTQNS